MLARARACVRVRAREREKRDETAEQEVLRLVVSPPTNPRLGEHGNRRTHNRPEILPSSMPLSHRTLPRGTRPRL